MKGVIDRFEGEYVVVQYDSGKLENIERCRIPKEAREEDVLIFGDIISIDYEETKKRKEKIQKLAEEIWK